MDQMEYDLVNLTNVVCFTDTGIHGADGRPRGSKFKGPVKWMRSAINLRLSNNYMLVCILYV
jgi:hypothetical protein